MINVQDVQTSSINWKSIKLSQFKHETSKSNNHIVE